MRFLIALFASMICAVAAFAQDAWHGLKVETVTPEVMAAKKLMVPFGARVAAVEPRSPAEGADVAVDDVIIAAAAARVATREDFEAVVGPLKAGAAVELSLLRGSEARKVAMVLASRGSEPQQLAPPRLVLDTSGHTSSVAAIAFSSDGKHLVSAGKDKVIRIWDWQNRRIIRSIRGDIGVGLDGTFYTLALSPDVTLESGGDKGILAVAGRFADDRKGIIRLIDLAPGRPMRLLEGHDQSVQSLAFSNDGKRLVSGGFDRTAIVWDVERATALHTLRGHGDTVYSVSFALQGKRVVTASLDKKLRLWDADKGRLSNTLSGHQDYLFAVAAHPTRDLIASGSLDGDIRIWSAARGKLVRVLDTPGGEAFSLAFVPGGTQLLVGSSGVRGAVSNYIWDAASGKLMSSLRLHDNNVRAVAVTSDGRFLASAGGNGNVIRVWKRGDNPETKATTLSGSGRSLWNVGFSADGKSIAWGADPDYGSPNPLINRGLLKFQLKLPGSGERLGSPAAISLSLASQAQAWHRATDRQGDISISQRSGENYEDTFLDIKRKGVLTASIKRIGKDGLGRHHSYSIAPDGKTIISGSGVLLSYDLEGRETGRFVGQLADGNIWAVALSPDGRYLLSGGGEQVLQLWNVATRQLVVSLFHGSDGEWVMWTPEGYYTGSERAGDIVGWQQNQGPDKAARYVTGGTLRNILSRPDIVERAIVLADSAAAAAELAGDGPSLAELVRNPPPDVHLWGDYTSANGRATIVLEIERTGRTAEAFTVQLGTRSASGDFVAERTIPSRAAVVPASYKPTYATRELRAFEVDLKAGSNVLRVATRTAVGEAFSNTTDILSRADALGEQAGVLRVLAIGIDRYTGAAGLASLAFAGKDAADFAATAVKALGGRHAGTSVEVLINGAGPAREPTKANIEAALTRFKQAGPQDTILLFIAGHGESRRGRYVLLPTDFRRADASEPGQNAVDWRLIRDALDDAKVARKLVFLDTCYAGNSYNDNLSGDARSLAFAAFTASQAGALAKEDKALGQGLFTHVLRRGLEGDAMRGNRLTVYGLGSYLNERVSELSRGAQLPEFWSGIGNPVLVQN